jgi:hypothetical protein
MRGCRVNRFPFALLQRDLLEKPCAKFPKKIYVHSRWAVLGPQSPPMIDDSAWLTWFG